MTHLDRANRLIKSFKHLASDQNSDRKRGIVLGSYLEEVLVALKPMLKLEHSIRLEVKETMSLQTQPGALSEILFVLINNSIKHGFSQQTPSTHVSEMGPPQIVVSARFLSAQSWELRYSDNGRGLTQTELEALFKPLASNRSQEGSGGLGLLVVHEIVTLVLNGQIEAQSSPGRGVQFIMQFPL
jgi:signal transduction histidine kinase